MELKRFEGQNIKELSMVEVAYAIIEESGDVHDFNKLLELIQDYLEMTEKELEDKMARFYTDINIDGRFISLGENRWGLRAWYPVDSIDEEIVSTIDDEDLPRRRRRRKTNKINAFGDGEDMIDYNEDDPEDIDDIYDDYDLEEDDDEDDELEGLTEMEIEDDEDDEDMDSELKDYEGDLSEFGDDDINLNEETEFDDDEEFFENEEDVDEELVDMGKKYVETFEEDSDQE